MDTCRLSHYQAASNRSLILCQQANHILCLVKHNQQTEWMSTVLTRSSHQASVESMHGESMHGHSSTAAVRGHGGRQPVTYKIQEDACQINAECRKEYYR